MGATLVMEQHVPGAGPAAVWEAWTTEEAMAAWWWPQWPDTTYRIDARVHGSYEIVSEAVGVGVRGEYTALDEPRRIEFTWTWLTGGVGEVVEPVEVDLEPTADGGTLVTVTHHLADQAGEGDDIRLGWTHVLARLGDLRDEG